MRRIAVALALVLGATTVAQAGPLAGFERFWGIHTGAGIHAKDGCPGRGGYAGAYGYPAEEVAPGEPETASAKSHRQNQSSRTTRVAKPADADESTQR